MANKIVAPSVHLNGTSCASLHKELTDAASAVSDAIDALPHPNARDYYIQDDADAYDKARRQQQRWAVALRTVFDEICAVEEIVVARHEGREVA